MKIHINGITIDKWANLNVSLIYNSVASVFSFDLYWDPFDAKMRPIMLPGAYNECTIVADNGETLITGVMHSPAFKSSAVPNLVNISGYSRTGVLQDCEYSALFPTTQSDSLTLLQIAQNICNAFGFGTVIDKTDGAANKTFQQSDFDHDKSCMECIASLAKDLNITLSHDSKGNLVLSIAKETKPVFDFTAGMPGVVYDLAFNGQEMHNRITAVTQGGGTNSFTVYNPYVNNRFNFKAAISNDSNIFNAPAGKLSLANEYSTGFRPSMVIQTESDNSNLEMVAKNALADELQAISFSIKLDRWDLNGRIPRPEDIITALNPELYLFKKTKLFIQSIDFSGDERFDCCVVNVVVPEVFNGNTPINIFTANNNNATFATEVNTTPREGDRLGRQPNL